MSWVKLPLVLICCSTPENCTSSVVNWLVSIGLVGSWFFNWVISICRKSLKLLLSATSGLVAAALAAALVLELLALLLLLAAAAAVAAASALAFCAATVARLMAMRPVRSKLWDQAVISSPTRCQRIGVGDDSDVSPSESVVLRALVP